VTAAIGAGLLGSVKSGYDSANGPCGVCDAAHVGATSDSFYTADYYFFGD